MSKKNKNKSYGKYVLIVLGIFILDQITKYIIQKNLSLHESISVIKNFFYITYTTNTGAGFSILQNQNQLLLFISIFVFGFLLYYFDSFKKTEQVAVSFILGGVLGNVFDRIVHGSVVDFIAFTFWPTFNVADMAISLSIIYLIVMEFRK